MDTLRIQLRAVFYKERNQWVAHCLEMDILGHGRTKEQAFRKMNEAIGLQVAASMHFGNRANIFMPADARFFEMFSAGKDIAIGEAVFKRTTKKISESAQDRVVIQDFETREYNDTFAHA